MIFLASKIVSISENNAWLSLSSSGQCPGRRYYSINQTTHVWHVLAAKEAIIQFSLHPVYTDGVEVALKNYIEHATVELKKNTPLENWMYISTDILSEYSASADIFTTIVYKSSYVYTVAFGETLLCCYVVQVNSYNAGYNCMFIWIKSGKKIMDADVHSSPGCAGRTD